MRLQLTRPLSQLLALCLLLAAVTFWIAKPAAAEGPSPAERMSQQAGLVASFTVSIPGVSGASPNAPVHQAVSFDASGSQGSGIGYTWTFGDGSPNASGQKVTHAFSTVDDFNVTLTVGSATGPTASSSQTVRVVPLVQ